MEGLLPNKQYVGEVPEPAPSLQPCHAARERNRLRAPAPSGIGAVQAAFPAYPARQRNPISPAFHFGDQGNPRLRTAVGAERSN